VLPDERAGSYDYGRDPHVAEALMNDREAKSISDVAAELRAEILAGKYSGEDSSGRRRKVPSRTDLKERFGLSPESCGVVLRMLATEGLIRMEQGRGTFAEPVQRYVASVTAERADGDADETLAAASRIRDIEGAGLSEAEAICLPGSITAKVTVVARDAGYASARASAVVRSALGDGWTITNATAG
jgi:DNA-binding GntR family transcriptional regulator